MANKIRKVVYLEPSVVKSIEIHAESKDESFSSAAEEFIRVGHEKTIERFKDPKEDFLEAKRRELEYELEAIENELGNL